jgi:hypothetical protein
MKVKEIKNYCLHGVYLLFQDQRNNLRSDLVKLYICLKQIIINYGN